MRLRAHDLTITLQAVSYWWKRRSPSKFASHYTWGTNGVCMWMQDGCKRLHGFLLDIEWTMFHGHLDNSWKSPLGGKFNTQSGDHGTPNAHNYWFILFHHVWGYAWIEIHGNIIWLRARSHMTSHYSWGSVTTLHGFGGVLEQPLDTSFWALTISWSWLLVGVWSGPNTYALIQHFGNSLRSLEGWNKLENTQIVTYS